MGEPEECVPLRELVSKRGSLCGLESSRGSLCNDGELLCIDSDLGVIDISILIDSLVADGLRKYGTFIFWRRANVV